LPPRNTWTQRKSGILDVPKYFPGELGDLGAKYVMLLFL